MAHTIAGAQSLQDLSFGTDTTFEVVTWNLEDYPKNGTKTIDSVAIAIMALDADIYALQEINSKLVSRQIGMTMQLDKAGQIPDNMRPRASSGPMVAIHLISTIRVSPEGSRRIAYFPSLAVSCA